MGARRLAFNPADALQFSIKRDANCRRGRPITRDRGALAHDDRIDAVAGAVAHFQRAAMMMDVDQAAQAMKEAEIEDFLEGFNQPTYRGMRVNGQRAPVWSSPTRLERDVKTALPSPPLTPP
jgi:hypothetical protein